MCENLAPGFRCGPCPSGYEGEHFDGYYSQSLVPEYRRQECRDIDECEKGIAQCDENSECSNTPGSYHCSCKRGYKLNGAYGCIELDTLCPDGSYCDRNAYCKHVEGLRVSRSISVVTVGLIYSSINHVTVSLCMSHRLRWQW